MTLTIGSLARQAGIGVQTIRFYEREGLIEAAPRASSGYRTYDEQALNRLNFIRRAQALGFTLREIRELIALQVNRAADCADVRRAANTKLADVEQKIADLTRMKTALHELVESCQGPEPNCKIMECLSSTSEFVD